ncbi:MAG: transposase [Candidatus Paceibacterota bacterium]
MPKRNPPLITGTHYHVFNRTIAGQKVFITSADIKRMLDLVDYCRFPHRIRYSELIRKTPKEQKNMLSNIIEEFDPVIELYTAEIMSNHYHIIAKQLAEDGIRYFVSNLQNAFAKYYNDKYDRNGGMFQSPFKAINIESEEQLKHIIRYNHLNPVTAGIISIDELEYYETSSFQYYVHNDRTPIRLFDPKNPKAKFISTHLILSLFETGQAYKQFVFNQADYQRSLHELKKLI